MVKKLITCLFTLMFMCTASAQSGADSVKAAITGFFNAMRNADSAALRQVLADGALLQTITRSGDGKVMVRNEPVQAFLAFVAKQAAGEADERIQFQNISIDGPLAAAWTPYSFFYKGRFSHCGVNSFQLVRMDNTWRIQYIIDTRRKDNCR